MEPSPELVSQCISVLQEYFNGGGDPCLNRAYQLGCVALAAGAGVAECVIAHLQALGWSVGGMSNLDEVTQAISRAVNVFAESLAPYERIHRRFLEAQTTMQEAEERYRGLIEIAPDMVFSLSPEGEVTSLNPAFEKATGWPREEWLGKPFGAHIHPADLDRAEELLRRILRRETSPTLELRVRSRWGDYLIKEVTATPEIRDGKVIGVVGIARDITRRRRAEEALRRLFEGVPIGLCRTTPAGQLLDANPALVQMLAYPDMATLLGTSMAELYVDLEDRRRWDTLMERRGVVRDFEIQLRRHDGGIIWVRSSAQAFRDAETRVSYYEEALEDISERKQAERALRRLNERLEEEAKRIAHALHDETGQALTAIHLDLEIVARTLPSAARERLHGIRVLLKQFEEQLRGLSHELRPMVLDDLGLVPALKFLARSLSKRTGIRIEVDGGEEARLSPSIEIALYRIVQEGLTNVAKYAQATHAWIRVGQTGQHVRCSLRDNGAGFDAARVLARRGERGIGLVGMRERAEALGGTLEINSTPGRGTELLERVPLHP